MKYCQRQRGIGAETSTANEQENLHEKEKADLLALANRNEPVELFGKGNIKRQKNPIGRLKKN